MKGRHTGKRFFQHAGPVPAVRFFGTKCRFSKNTQKMPQIRSFYSYICAKRKIYKGEIAFFFIKLYNNSVFK